VWLVGDGLADGDFFWRSEEEGPERSGGRPTNGAKKNRPNLFAPSRRGKFFFAGFLAATRPGPATWKAPASFFSFPLSFARNALELALDLPLQRERVQARFERLQLLLFSTLTCALSSTRAYGVRAFS
jgi:hypothetical protein